jgi:hypothetical protein
MLGQSQWPDKAEYPRSSPALCERSGRAVASVLLFAAGGTPDNFPACLSE